MKTKNILTLILVCLILITTIPVSAATPPDVIHNYTVTITPQSDGTLNMRYDFSYCATTDFPGAAYLDIGVANRHFSLTDYGPKDWIIKTTEYKSGKSQVHLEFAKLPLAGDCFDFWFTINQQAMANVKGEEVSFEFFPGYFDFAEIKNLTIIWVVPEDTSAIHYLNPENEVVNGKITWTAQNLAPNQKFTVELLLAKSVFPDLSPDQAISDPTPSKLNADILFIIIVVVIGAAVLTIAIIWWSTDTTVNDDYKPGRYIGNPTYKNIHTTPRPSYRPPSISRPLSPRPSSPRPSRRTTGYGGSRSGRGSSCACVSSCACACACAGGGRAGCTQKGFLVGWLTKRKKDYE